MSPKSPLRRDGVKARSLGDEVLLYDETNGGIHVVNPMAEFVWRLCDGEHGVGEIEEKIRATHTVPDSVDVKTDVEKILSEFANLGVLSD